MEPPFPGMDPYLEQPGMWPDVHLRLIAASCDAIQAQLNPDYIAVITPYVTLESIEIAPTRQAFVPDIGILQEDSSIERGVATVIAAAPLTVPVSITIPTRYARIEIRSVTHNTLVTSIELLSPANKRSGADGADAYEKKRQELFQSDVHLLEIDLLRGGVRPRLARPLLPAPYFIFLSRSYRRPLVDIWPFVALIVAGLVRVDKGEMVALSSCGDVRDSLPAGPHPLAPAPARGSGGNRASGGGEGSTERDAHPPCLATRRRCTSALRHVYCLIRNRCSVRVADACLAALPRPRPAAP